MTLTETTPAPPQDRPAPPAPSATGAAETELVVLVRWFVAICSFSAGVLHLLAMAAHADHHPAVGRAFLAVAVLQLAWGVLLLVHPRRWVVVAGAVLTAGATLAWVYTRTKGISWFPGLELPEPIEWRDVVTQFFQILALAGAAVLLLPARVHQPADPRRPPRLAIGVMSLLALSTLGLVYAATHDYTHHDHQPGSADEGHSH